tara:strand:- start:1476 stop:2378 length:903 start_codon:yes stop_codon:yes gene_type:complete
MKNYNGWINVYKPKNISSFNVIRKVKKVFKFSKIGHAGTLDPAAEGILPLAVGKSTKLISFINEKEKIYEFNIKWGLQTDTDDQDGQIISFCKKIPSKDEIEKILYKFIGNIMQKPPKVSAIKINGERAYNRFRNNEIFETKERLVKVYNLNMLERIDNNTFKFSVECGKGFYVRSLARDLANSLNTKAHICYLKRVKVGNFNQNNSILLDDLLKISEMADGIKGFHSSISVLDDIPAFEIESKEMLNNISNGNQVRPNIFISNSLFQSNKNIYFAIKNGKIISLGKKDGNFFKPKKILL